MNNLEEKIKVASLVDSDPQILAKICCQRARRFEQSGNYQTAVEILSPFWAGIGSVPNVEDLEDELKADIFLRAGVLTGWIGHSENIPHSQETAKDLISKGQRIYAQLEIPEKIAESQVELGYCYWREGALDDARAIYSTVIKEYIDNPDISDDIKAYTYLRSSVIESASTRTLEAIELLETGLKSAEKSQNNSLKGSYYNQIGLGYQRLGDAEKNSAHYDRAFIEYSAASYYFEQAEHKRYLAAVENNIGLVLLSLERFSEAYQHFDKSRKMFLRLKENIIASQMEESIARALIASDEPELAEKFARKSVETFEKAERFALLTEALITQGIAQARMGKHELARETFERAEQVAARMDIPDWGGLAILTLLEELEKNLSLEESYKYYLRADGHYRHKPQYEILERLRKTVHKIVTKIAASQPETAIIQAAQNADQPTLDEMIRQTEIRFQKSVKFTPEAIEAMQKFYFVDNFGKLEKIIENTVKKAENDALITSDSVEIVALRNTTEVNFAHPWENLSLRDFTHSIEKRFIELALKEANGSITKAGNLLGFKHYEMLNSIIKSRHPDLLAKRTAPAKRKRSIIKKPFKK
jgi:tetratricopeptide (TPR) repeat protein